MLDLDREKYSDDIQQKITILCEVDPVHVEYYKYLQTHNVKIL